MAAPFLRPRVGPEASQSVVSCLFLLLLLLPRPQGAATAHRHPDSKGVTLTPDIACGQRRVQSKVMGGADAPEKKWPWQVSVHYAGFHICGGTIIHEYWVLSAAHCFGRIRDNAKFDLYVGLVNLKVAGSHTQWFEVNKVILHDTYEVYHPIGGDIALVQLKTPIVFSDSVLPVCIAPPNANLQNLTCWATGWGLVSQKASTDHLQEVRVSLIPRPICQLLYGYMSYVLPDMLCAGDLKNMKTVCEGDSGGPLVCEVNHVWVQYGTVSWGRGCTFPMYPAVYAHISYFSNWIRHHVEHTPPPPQPLPALSSARGAALSVLTATLAVLPVL